MKTIHLFVVVAGVLAVAVYAAYAVADRDEPELWLQDFAKLQRELGAGYANLD